ncbi:MAG: hypothetical protein CMI13_02600 [Oleibacter sp.]|nr:hypothetical protein [Thalassolituus sp.]|tara:strand:+ start:1030 stop:1728 length:699 start_codon:yes stop_codon:yes gene_type:complete
MKAFKIAFSAIGIFMLFACVYSSIGTYQFIQQSATTTGEVLKIDSYVATSDGSSHYMYRPIVGFIANGQGYSFVSSMSSSSPAYSVGERVEVIYDPENPGRSGQIKGFFSQWIFSIISALMGITFSAVGLGMTWYGIANRRKAEQLMREGQPVLAKIESIGHNTRFSFNGRNPYQITAQWQNPQTSQIHIFKSDNIWFDPSAYIDGDDVPVLIDKNNPKRYHVDLSFLPKTA